MAQTVISEKQIEAHIHGDVSGQLAVGNNILQIGSNKGVVIFHAAPEQRPTIRPRQTPVDLRPRPFNNLLGRQSEVNNATSAMRSQQPAEFFGEDGLGKTALLRHLAHHSASNSFRDGVVYLDAGHSGTADLLHNLFGSFYESDAPYKPGEADIRHALHSKQALVILDDIDLTREEVDSLMDAAPRCTFLFASPARRLWNEGSATALRGLPLPDALELVERTLDRSLKADEQPAAHTICTALKGHPLRIIQSVYLARQHNVDLQAIANQLQSEFPNTILTKQILESLSEPEQRIVKALAALGNAPLHVAHVTAVTALSNADDLLQKLQALKLVQSHSPRYSLTGTWAQTLQQQWDLTAWAERILIHLIAWAERNRQRPDIVLPEFESILEILDWARSHDQWRHVLRLAWAVEGAFALAGRWDAWAHILQAALQAARALKNRAAEAWSLHQLGSRAGCLGDRATASASLAQAIRMREQLGDDIGAGISRHNLETLLGPPVPPSQPPSPPSAPATPAPTSGAIPFVVKAIVTLMAIPVIGLAVAFLTNPPTPQPVPPTNIDTITFTPIDTASPTSTETSTPTPSATSTSSASATSTPTPCGPPSFWSIYIVQPGDTLFSIATATGITVEQLMLANCRVNTVIGSGERMYVPLLPVTDTPTASATSTQTSTPTSTSTNTPTHTSTPTDTPSYTFTPTFTPTLIIGTIRGRVLWNEQPVSSATVYATDLANFDSTRYGSAVTDSNGVFSISGVPEGEGYLYIFGNQPEFWLTALTPFRIVSGGVTDAEDSYLCKGLDPISPRDNETVYTSRPILAWPAYPDAIDYAVRVLPKDASAYVWSRGDSDARIKETRVQLDVDLGIGQYSWRVDAFNAAGHIIGCSFYPRYFWVNTIL